jgi:Leucine-rich repeat (LRR) protein
MGNISSVLGRGGDDNSRNNSDGENGRRQVLTGEDFISESVAGMELNHQDYQLTLHQYLSQRYADRYNNTQYDYTQTQQQQRQRSHETPTTNSNNKETLSKHSSYTQSTDLIILSLKGKKIKDVPADLFYHDEITSLDLSNNGKQQRKTNVIIKNSHFLEITILPKGFKKMKNLSRLALGGNQIISLPEEISTLKEMTWLDFTNNRISEIPASFSGLKKLTSLGASDCRFSEFPQVICQMKNIRKLGIFNNLFSSLPLEIGNLRLMTKLDLSGNALTSLPDEIGNLTELSWLNLSQNRLESIPASMAKLTKLKELGLSHNKLKRLPDLSPLTELTLLPVYNNELEELGDWIGNLVELNKIDLSCNELKSIPASILLPPKLTFINLRKNRLKHFPDKIYDRRVDAMTQVPSPMKLCTIDVRENELEHLPLALIGPSLVELKTAMNPWKEYDVIDISTNSIEIPSLLNISCAQMIRSEALRPLLATTTLPIQIHILQNTRRCQFCEKPLTHRGMDCVLWRATTDTTEVPFTANVCCKTCMESLDAQPI